MELFGSLFLVLAIITMLFLVIGFLNHSVGLDEAKEKEPTRKWDTMNALAFIAMGVGWAWQFWLEYSDDQPSWFLLATSAFCAIGGIWAGILFARKALQQS